LQTVRGTAELINRRAGKGPESPLAYTAGGGFVSSSRLNFPLRKLTRP
jgi:hypothetical protein